MAGVYKWKIAVVIVLLGGASIALFNESVADQPALLVTERDICAAFNCPAK